MLTRRWFIGGLCSSFAVPHFEALSAAEPLAAPSLARLGVLSDIHRDEPERSGYFRKALLHFRDAGVDGVALLTRHVLAPGFNRPQQKDEPHGECLFALSELPTDTPLKFEVCAKECFGRMGSPISSQTISIASQDKKTA